MEALGITQGQFWAGILLLARVAGLFTFVPPLSNPIVPRRVKAAAALVMTFSLLSLGVAGQVVPPGGFVEMTLMVAREAAIGLMLGLTAQILFLAVLFGGQVMGTQMGMNVASLMDPQFQASVAEVSYIYYYGAMLMFLAVGGDRMVIETFVGNLHALPLGRSHVPPVAVKAMIFWTGEIFSTGFSLVAPVMASLFATSVLLGILARSVPQINMLMLGYSLKIIVGLLVMALFLPAWMDAFLRFMGRMFEMMAGMSSVMGG